MKHVETKREIVQWYLKNELKEPQLTKEERQLLQDTLLYLTQKDEKEQAAWEAFVARMEAKKEEWEKRHLTDGLSFEYDVSEATGLRSFSLNLKKEGLTSWLIEIHVLEQAHQKILFDSVVEELDDLQFDTFEELEQTIDTFFLHEAFQLHIEEIKNKG